MIFFPFLFGLMLGKNNIETPYTNFSHFSLHHKMAVKEPKKEQKEQRNTVHKGSIKGVEQKRKQVYKPVLENPYIRDDNWPYIDQELGQNVVDLLCRFLEPIGKYSRYLDKSDLQMEVPAIKDHITVGFNSTNQLLENLSKLNRGEIKKTLSPKICMVFVCKVDITPALLVQHFPVLVRMASTKESPVKLVQLPRGSMAKLGSSLNRQSVGIVGVSLDSPGGNILQELVMEKVLNVSIPWLESLNFQKPNIKLLVTSQPVLTKKNDQKLAKKNK